MGGLHEASKYSYSTCFTHAAASIVNIYISFLYTHMDYTVLVLLYTVHYIALH